MLIGGSVAGLKTGEIDEALYRTNKFLYLHENIYEAFMREMRASPRNPTTFIGAPQCNA
ncbi:hypothetical protein [Massilia suwonensis]|uniref:Uncharacterized protein n=1 Tax=Massilia suwonensis TaxID=648895 RepID=A0ABW0MIZ2_9BURK